MDAKTRQLHSILQDLGIAGHERQDIHDTHRVKLKIKCNLPVLPRKMRLNFDFKNNFFFGRGKMEIIAFCTGLLAE